MAAQAFTAAQDSSAFTVRHWSFTATLELLSVRRASLELHSQVSVRRASPLSSVLVTRAILVTALVTTLVTRFSSNSYVFL